MNWCQLRLWALQKNEQVVAYVLSCMIGAMARIQLILLVGGLKSSIAVGHLFRQVSQELLEDAPTINTHPVRPCRLEKLRRKNDHCAHSSPIWSMNLISMGSFRFAAPSLSNPSSAT